MAKTKPKAVQTESKPRPLSSQLLDIEDQVTAARSQARHLSEFGVDVIMSDRDSEERQRAFAALQLFAKDIADRLNALERAVATAREAA
jgi:hypothetical protein